MELDQGLLFALVGELLREDMGRGDLTTQSVMVASVNGRGRFLAKQDCIICGIEAAEAVFASLHAHLQLESFVTEGDEVKAGKEFARIEGPGDVLLTGERTALNLIQHMSGIATLTRKYVDAIAGTNAKIIDTRKTTPGLRFIDKYAVTVGGGVNHRFGLDDGILIKDNHIKLAGGIKEAVKRARQNVHHLLKIEVEVANFDQLREALATGVEVILLDNMTPEQIRQGVEIIRGEAGRNVITEASGGINLENVRQYAEAGADLISVGAITHQATAIDISFKITFAR
ncbi:MAG TPA: carboxylating nicotinate-nucleotide diphosphorylase [Blastocatellia bacterium]|nr:carboxylating nicotinate-nucleotide diphosphorylase [Blastocatellia bacterium]